MVRDMSRIRGMINDQVFPLLDRWFERAIKKSDIAAACAIAAHLAFLFKNEPHLDAHPHALSTIVSSQVFLTHNFGRDAKVQDAAPTRGRKSDPSATSAPGELYGLPQPQLFDVFQKQRHAILHALKLPGPAGAELCARALDAVTRVVTFTGPPWFAEPTGAPPEVKARDWQEMDESRNAGRFVVDRGAPQPVFAAAPYETYEAWLARQERASSAHQEINIQLAEY